MGKMRKEIAIVVAAAILLSVLMVLPVISRGENVTNASDMGGTLLSELSEAPTSGSWVGTTSEGKNVSFNVSGLQVYNFTVITGNPNNGVTSWAFFNPIDIVENDFQLQFLAIMIYGEFISPYFATGTYRTGTVNITWSASPQTTPTPTPTRIEVTPSTKTLDVGETQQFTATAYDQSGNPMAGVVITWTSSNTAVGTVSPASATTGSDGKATTTFTAYASGTTTVKAAHGTVSGSASVSVGDLGCKIAFNSDRDGDDEIYVMDADGTNVKQLTSNTALDEHPAWSPDGSQIAFASFDGSNPEIYVMDADGTNVKKRTNTLSPTINEGPCWSPDGNKIAFVWNSSYADNEIYVMDADGANIVQITSNSADDKFPDWCCPNGGKTTVSIESASAPKGSTVTVPIRITNVTNLATANIWLSYNKDVVTVDSVSEGDLSPVTTEINNAAGVTKISWFSSTGKIGDFVFAYVTLKAVGNTGQSCLLDLDVKELSDTSANTIPHTATGGSFEVNSSLMEGDVTKDKHVTMADAMFIAQYKAGLRSLNESKLKCADTTDDGDVTMADAMHIAQ